MTGNNELCIDHCLSMARISVLPSSTQEKNTFTRYTSFAPETCTPEQIPYLQKQIYAMSAAPSNFCDFAGICTQSRIWPRQLHLSSPRGPTHLRRLRGTAPSRRLPSTPGLASELLLWDSAGKVPRLRAIFRLHDANVFRRHLNQGCISPHAMPNEASPCTPPQPSCKPPHQLSPLEHKANW